MLSVNDRLGMLRKLQLPNVKVVQIANEYGIEIDDDPLLRLAHELIPEDIDEIYFDYRYAGRVSSNYFYMLDLGTHSTKEIADRLSRNAVNSTAETGNISPSRGRSNWKIQLDEFIERDGKRLVGFIYEGKPVLVSDEGEAKVLHRLHHACVVLREGSDLLEVRSSNYHVGRHLYNLVKRDKFEGNPIEFDKSLEEAFREKVEKYTDATVDIPLNRSDPYVGREKLYGRPDGTEKKDIRKSPKFRRMAKDGHVTLAYAIIQTRKDEKIRIQLNTRLGRISFRAHVSEEMIDKIGNLVEEVYEKVEGHPQTSLLESLKIPSN